MVHDVPRADWPCWLRDLAPPVRRVVAGADWIALDIASVWCGWRTPRQNLSLPLIQTQAAGMVDVVAIVAETARNAAVNEERRLPGLVVRALSHGFDRRFKASWACDLVPTSNHDGRTLYEVRAPDGMVVSVGRKPDVLPQPLLVRLVSRLRREWLQRF